MLKTQLNMLAQHTQSDNIFQYELIHITCLLKFYIHPDTDNREQV